MKKSLSTLVALSLLVLPGCELPFVDSLQQDPAEEALDNETRMIVTLKNISTDQTLAPGIFFSHEKKHPLDFAGELAPKELLSYAISDQPSAFEGYVGSLEEVETVFLMPVGLAPGETYSFQIMKAAKYISGLEMVSSSEDGYVLVDTATLERDTSLTASNMDFGSATDASAEVSAHSILLSPILQMDIKARDY